MNLVIDIGNTRSKLGIFEKNTLIGFAEQPHLTLPNLQQFLKNYPDVAASILSTVSDYDASIQTFLEESFQHVQLTNELPIPIQNNYATPQTLGNDRLAVAVAANHLFPNQNNVIVDAGTCITFDFIDHTGSYKGGAILPGIEMKFQALHTFTSKLPLLSRYKTNNNAPELVGNNTQNSLLSGVLNGCLFEIEGFCRAYQNKYKELNIIFTGGDHKYFVENLNFKTFAESNLLMNGLNIILNFNVEKQKN